MWSGGLGKIRLHVFFAGILQVILDVYEREKLEIKPHVMQKPCSLRHPHVMGFGWISIISVKWGCFWLFDIVLCKKKITSKKPVNFLGFGLSRYRYYSYYKILYMYTVYTYLYTYVYIVYMILCTCGCGYRCTANVTDTQCFPQTRSLGICCSLVPETASARSDLTAARMDDEPWERAFVWHFWQAWSFWNHISSFWVESLGHLDAPPQ